MHDLHPTAPAASRGDQTSRRPHEPSADDAPGPPAARPSGGPTITLGFVWPVAVKAEPERALSGFCWVRATASGKAASRVALSVTVILQQRSDEGRWNDIAELPATVSPVRIETNGENHAYVAFETEAGAGLALGIYRARVAVRGDGGRAEVPTLRTTSSQVFVH